MSEIVEESGVVKRVGSKKVGKRVYYNFTLEDDDTLYMTGTKRPDFDEGDEVSFECEDTDYGWMVDMDTVEVDEAEERPRRRKKSSSKKKGKSASKKKTHTSRGRSAESVAKSSGNKKSDRDAYWEQKAIDDKHRQHIISYQAAYNTALEMIKAGLDAGVVKLATEKAAVGKKWQSLQDQVKDLAQELYTEFNSVEKLSTDSAKMPSDEDVEDDDAEDQVDDGEDEEFDDD